MEYKLSMAEITTKKWKFDEDVRNYYHHNYNAISVWLDKLGNYGIKEAIRVLKKYPIKVSSLVFSGQYTQSTEEERQERIKETMEHIEIASKIGAEFICVVPGIPAPEPGMSEKLSCGLTRQEAQDTIVKALRALSPLAEAKGVNLAVEPLHRERMKFVSTIEEALEVVKLVDSPRVGILLDTYQLGLEENILKDIESLKDYLFGVDISDRPFQTPASFEEYLLPGEGAVPLARIIAAVRKIGYKGYYNIEIFSKKMWDSDYFTLLRECKERFNSVWEQSERMLNKL
ncbi:sugar phosphate isomerase/epimerase [Candidatus Aerophobetes bacterium]|nr:sugar phosphate isomerase/epimerase [Candidatus Aerophobetes bacterium]